MCQCSQSYESFWPTAHCSRNGTRMVSVQHYRLVINRSSTLRWTRFMLMVVIRSYQWPADRHPGFLRSKNCLLLSQNLYCNELHFAVKILSSSLVHLVPNFRFCSVLKNGGVGVPSLSFGPWCTLSLDFLEVYNRRVFRRLTFVFAGAGRCLSAMLVVFNAWPL